MAEDRYCPAGRVDNEGNHYISDHCWHAHSSDTWDVGVNSYSSRLVTKQCCWCSQTRTIKYYKGLMEGHGPHSKGEWREIDEIKKAT